MSYTVDQRAALPPHLFAGGSYTNSRYYAVPIIQCYDVRDQSHRRLPCASARLARRV